MEDLEHFCIQPSKVRYWSLEHLELSCSWLLHTESMEVLDIFHLEGMLEALEQKNLLLASKILHGFLESKSILLFPWNVLWTLGAPMESTSKLGRKQISFLWFILFHSWSSNLRVPMQNSSKIGQKQLSWLLAFFSLDHGSPMARPRIFSITYGALCSELHICLGLKKLKLLTFFSFLLKFMS